MFKLAGYRTLIMGAAAPIPTAITMALAAEGASLALTTSTSDGEEAFALRRLSRRVVESGATCIVESVDLALGANVQITVRQVAKALGGIDLAIIAPELRVDKAPERLTDAEWSRVINGNLGAVFYACRGIAREMMSASREGAGGLIIVLRPSIADGSQDAAFAAAIAGIDGLVANLAQQWLEKNVLLSLIALPFTASESATAEIVGQVLALVKKLPR